MRTARFIANKWFAAAQLATGALLCAPGITIGQLLSPGPLSNAHASLEGVTNCTSCHTVGGRGVDRSKCLSCHEPLRRRIDAKSGFHAGVEPQCESCHREHLGREFDLVKLDEQSFDHREAGPELLQSHAETACRDCHKPNLIRSADILASAGESVSLTTTFLGLSSECAACHSDADPHAGQFSSRSCLDCHQTTKWKDITFSHEATAFRLSGRHASLECQTCHKSVSSEAAEAVTHYVGLQFGQCSDCHVDPHKTKFGATCNNCHLEEGWGRLTKTGQGTFGHDGTGFTLVGAHAGLACATCHRSPARSDKNIDITFTDANESKSFRPIERSKCSSCHVDFHATEFKKSDGEDCSTCHTQNAWRPVLYGIDRHNQDATFLLVGAHESTPCEGCHRREGKSPRFRFDGVTCEGCHGDKNPHNTAFADDDGSTDCESCHTPSSWVEQIFDHQKTGFALTGRHADIVCSSCHPNQDFKSANDQCATCHNQESPHRGQFDSDCGSCHESTGFRPVSDRFDHAAGGFVLDGAHARIECVSCHKPVLDEAGESYVRYRPTPRACLDCHGQEER